MSNLVTKLTFAALLAGASLTATASPGDGIRLGGSEGRLHPFLELEGRWDSKAYVDPDPAAAKDVSDFIIHVRPGLKLSVPGDMTSVELSAALDIASYMGSDDPVTKDLSKVYAEAELGVTVNKSGVVGLELDDTFRRSDRPQALSIGSSVVSNYNVLGVRVPFRPGGGALTLNVNGGWALETYEAYFNVDCASLDPACTLVDGGYNELRAGAGAAWKFLPRTSALLDFGWFKRMPDLSTAADPTGFRVTAGLTGLVTPHIGATLKAGYGSVGSTAVSDSLGSWLATAELEWQPAETTRVSVGFGHDFAVDSVNREAQYETNKVSVEARQLVAGRFALALSAGFDQLSYSTGSNTILRVSPTVGVEVTRWLRAELGYAYTDRAASTDAPAFAANEYSKSEAWLKAVATY